MIEMFETEGEAIRAAASSGRRRVVLEGPEENWAVLDWEEAVLRGDLGGDSVGRKRAGSCAWEHSLCGTVRISHGPFW